MSAIEPDFGQILSEHVTRRHFPAHDGFMRRDDAMPPEQWLLVRLFEQPLLKQREARIPPMSRGSAQERDTSRSRETGAWPAMSEMGQVQTSPSSHVGMF